MKTFFALIIILTLSSNTALATCGLVPWKPLPPLGCNDLVALCQCDQDGDNCRWVWVCQ